MRGATGNIYCGLLEFEEMVFALHLLRPGDLLGDIGANVGVYTILAAKNAGASVVALEPGPSDFQFLERNVELNAVTDKVRLYNKGAGSSKQEVEFLTGMNAANHVAIPCELVDQVNSVKISLIPLNEVFVTKVPVLLKIDVEGFEWEVIMGASLLLQSPNLQAIIIELNGSSRRYDIHEEKIHDEILSYGFSPFSYEPFSRVLEPLSTYGHFNTIYIRNEREVRERISTAKHFSIFGFSI